MSGTDGHRTEENYAFTFRSLQQVPASSGLVRGPIDGHQPCQHSPRPRRETGRTHTPKYSRYPVAVCASAVQMNPCTVALRVSLSASPGNWYSTKNGPSRVRGVTSDSRRARSDRRDSRDCSGRIESRSQANTRPMTWRTPYKALATRPGAAPDSSARMSATLRPEVDLMERLGPLEQGHGTRWACEALDHGSVAQYGTAGAHRRSGFAV